jgi:DNA-directed RNA polymerase subunit RPC12/RpoP
MGSSSRREKKYCSNCGDRISHSATRCPYCGQRAFTRRLVITYIFIAIVLVALFFLVLDYLNIEFL